MLNVPSLTFSPFLRRGRSSFCFCPTLIGSVKSLVYSRPKQCFSGAIVQKLSLQSRIRLIDLPKTWRGRRAERDALKHWQKNLKELAGKKGEQHIARRKKPLVLEIDMTPTNTATEFSPSGIRFASNDALGSRLYRIVNPVPWSNKSRWIRWPTYLLVIWYGAILIRFCFNWEKVPISGRRRLRIISPSHVEAPKATIDSKLYPENGTGCISEEYKLRVEHVGAILAKIVRASGLENMKWCLDIEDAPDVANACASPCGQIKITTGMLSTAQTDDEMAAVLGHEIAHVLAGHGFEGLGKALLGGLLAAPFIPFCALGYFVSEELLIVSGIPLGVVALCWMYLSRRREGEADLIGQLLMADAGYDPAAAANVFQKLNVIEENQLLQLKEKHKNFKAPPQYMSTHPHTKSRISDNAERATEILQITGKTAFPPDASKRMKAEETRWRQFVEERHQRNAEKQVDLV